MTYPSAGERLVDRWPGRVLRPRHPVGPPPGLVSVALLVGLAAVIPLAYLLLRASDGGIDALALLWRARTLELMVSTASLGLAVVVGSVGLGVPLAWLTVRTDLPARRLWAILAIAPLAIPSYLLAFAFVGAFAPRGWVATLLEPVGDWGVPGSYGFGGAVVVLSLATMPYVVISARAALARLDPAIEEASRSLGRGPWGAARTAVLPVILPAVGAGALLACLYAISDFGAVSILRYDTLATAIYSQYRFSFDRSGAAVLALLLLGLALLLVWVEGRVRRRAALATPHGRTRIPDPIRLGPLALAGGRVHGHHRRPVSRYPGGHRHPVADRWATARAAGRDRAGGAARITRPWRKCGCASGHRGAAPGATRGALPRSMVFADRAAAVRGLCHPRHQPGTGDRVLHPQRRATAVPVALRSRPGRQPALPGAIGRGSARADAAGLPAHGRGGTLTGRGDRRPPALDHPAAAAPRYRRRTHPRPAIGTEGAAVDLAACAAGLQHARDRAVGRGAGGVLRTGGRYRLRCCCWSRSSRSGCSCDAGRSRHDRPGSPAPSRAAQPCKQALRWRSGAR